MNIRTNYGEFKDINIKPYGNEETYTLAEIKGNTEGEYLLLGFDAPILDDNVWRFWIECGYADGSADTHKVKLSHDDKSYIRMMYLEYKEKLKKN